MLTATVQRPPEKNAFLKSDSVATVRLVDDASKSEVSPFGSSILRALDKAPVLAPDPHAEHWEGPTGFHSGLWWRGIESSDRDAYVQGILWYTQVAGASADGIQMIPVQAVVERLNSWYVITDDDWKDPRSNTRVDVSVISALEQMGAVRIKKSTAKK